VERYFEVDSVELIECAADWIDSNTNGLADEWTQNASFLTPSIVTGNGFVGNAQRIDKIVANQDYISSNQFSITNNSDYILSVRYRSNDSVNPVGSLAVLNSIGSPMVSIDLDSNNTNAIVIQSAQFTSTDSIAEIYLSVIVNNWIEIDEIELIEI